MKRLEVIVPVSLLLMPAVEAKAEQRSIANFIRVTDISPSH